MTKIKKYCLACALLNVVKTGDQRARLNPEAEEIINAIFADANAQIAARQEAIIRGALPPNGLEGLRQAWREVAVQRERDEQAHQVLLQERQPILFMPILLNANMVLQVLGSLKIDSPEYMLTLLLMPILQYLALSAHQLENPHSKIIDLQMMMTQSLLLMVVDGNPLAQTLISCNTYLIILTYMLFAVNKQPGPVRNHCIGTFLSLLSVFYFEKMLLFNRPRLRFLRFFSLGCYKLYIEGMNPNLNHWSIFSIGRLAAIMYLVLDRLQSIELQIINSGSYIPIKFLG